MGIKQEILETEKQLESLKREYAEKTNLLEMKKRKLERLKEIDKIKEETILTVEENMETTPITIGENLRRIAFIGGNHKREKEFRIERKGRKITCRIYENGKIMAKGTSRCMEKDVFNYTLGVNLAELRALKNYYENKENDLLK